MAEREQWSIREGNYINLLKQKDELVGMLTDQVRDLTSQVDELRRQVTDLSEQNKQMHQKLNIALAS